jgi:hypothetical protein
MDTLLAPIAGARHREVGGVTVDIVPAANGRIKRAVYPPGFRWSVHMKPLVGTPLCMHAHVGFLAAGGSAGSIPTAAGSNWSRRRRSCWSPATTPGSSAPSRPC